MIPTKNNKKLDISVIVPAYNEEGYLAKCLESLLNQDLDRESYEVIVIDNGSTDNTREVAKKYDVKLIEEPKKGTSLARNRGIEEAQGRILAFTDADCRLPRYWLSKITKHFEADPKLDAIGGVFSFFDGNWLLKLIAKLSQPFVYHLSGGGMAIKKSSYQKIGGFENNVNLGEDVLLTFKLRKVGQIKIDKKLIAATSARRFSHNFLKTIFMYFTNDFALKITKKPLFRTFPDIR